MATTMTVLLRYLPNPNPTEEQLIASTAKLEAMVTAGQTNGKRYQEISGYHPGEIVDPSLVIRPFATLADAQEFGTFAAGNGATSVNYFSITA